MIVVDVPENNPCDKCNPCIRLRLMEMGFISGQKVNIREKKHGLFMVDILTDNDEISSTYALQPEELDRICLR